MRSFEDRLREALRQRADSVVPNQPAWADLLTRPDAAGPPRPGHRLWLAVATAAVVVLVPFFVVARYLSRTSHVSVDGGQGQLEDPSPSTGSPVAGPPDATLPAGFSPVSITRTSLRVGWALGTSVCGTEVCTALARTRDGGATWHSVPVPADVETPSPNGISRVRFANASDGWLFGPQVWATHDGGTSWRPVAPLGGPVISLEAADGRAWGLVESAEGVSATVEAAPVDTDDWKPVGRAAAAIGITLHGKVGYAVAPDGALVALEPEPAGIEERGVPCPAATVAAIAAPSDTEVAVVCAADPGAGSSTKTLLLSHDGGRTWSTAGVAPRGGQTSGLAAASTHTFVVAAASAASYLYRTTDAGKTWKTVFTDTGGGSPLKDLGFTDSTHGVVVLGAFPDAKLFVSSDAGGTWKAQVFAP
ncbi:MAG TPA: hypothetical protein VJ010_10155 [Actinomycetota bacterium]|nr:hypothetical protein [Actinomycetota bacterium]